MPLAPGDRLGHFEIVASLGAGNMGEVYRARDVRLGRDVAVKVLLPALAADDAAVARFAHEARAVAALSHPNIVALYDVGQQDRTAYVVTELLHGETLRERLQRGAVPVRKTIDYARQIAAAIAAAHDRGIVHRDLKPENIFLSADGRVKVLDFGVAQMTAPVAGSDLVTLAGTAADPSGAGLFGSVGYMAPEQLRGAAVDHRADIFALGCVIYELLTGRRPFAGGTPADTVAALLNAEPPPLGIPGSAPLERVLRRCLEKSPDERFQSARDLAFALDVATSEVAPAPAVAGLRRAPWTALGATAVVALAAGAAAAAFWLRGRVDALPPQQPIRFGIPAGSTWSDAVSISPDGRYLLYTGGTSTTPAALSTQGVPGGRPSGFAPVTGRFWLRALDSLEARPLSDTEAAVPLLFWSPDSTVVGYRAGHAIVIRRVPDGAPQVLRELPAAPHGVAWSPRGDVMILATAEGLFVMPAGGGEPKLLMRSEPGREIWRGSPAFLPDGDRFLFTVLASGAGEQALETRVATLDGRDLGTVLKGAVGATYVDGHVLFGAGGALYAQRFDLERLALVGERVDLAQSVAQDWRTGRLGARASDNGILVFRGAPRGDAQFTIVDRSGRLVRNVAAPDSYTNFSLSPDEQRLIVARRDPLTGQVTLWLIDVARGVTSLVSDTRDTEDADDPTWAPDGRHVAYRHGSKMVMRLANGGEERTLLDAEGYPDSFSSDGRFLTYGQPRGNVFEQWAVDLTQPGSKPLPLVSGVTLADETRFAPNGRWAAYHSNETGMAQVYVIPFPRTGEKWQVSQKGGVQPRWSADGQELFYLDPEGRLMAVRMPSSDPRQAAAPQILFATGLVASDALDQYAPTRNGFVIRAPVSAGADAGAVQVVSNWKALAAPRQNR